MSLNISNSWLEYGIETDFPIQNIPFGIIRYEGAIVPATRLGDFVIDLATLADFGYFDSLEIEDLSVFYQSTLNDFIAMGKTKTSAVRKRIQELLSLDNPELRDNEEVRKLAVRPVSEVEQLMPVEVGDYTDFYSSIEHATNVGKMFRDPENALLPNWRHLPVGYHGRSSSIVVSGAEIFRPKGQTRPNDAEPPVFGPSKMVDFELEMAFITSSKTKLGDAIPVDEAEKHIFGLVLFNDLSARDIQKWEYVPLGPFLSKSFGSVISPWIVTMEALEEFRTEGPVQQPEPLAYLQQKGKNHYDIHLEVAIKTEENLVHKICETNFKHMYWSMNQQLAHQTVAGCNIRPGDMYGSGTISGSSSDSYGSLLELTWKGTRPIELPDGTKRTFIQDNDTIIMRGYANRQEYRIGFGACIVKILPSKPE